MISSFPSHQRQGGACAFRIAVHASFAIILAMMFAACRSKDSSGTQTDDFFTSGNRAADQRATQRVLTADRLENSAPTPPETSPVAGDKSSPDSAPETAGTDPSKTTLYERLGGEEGLGRIMEDFLPRVMQDPRVNWARNGVTRGGLSLYRNRSVAWTPDEDAVARLRRHMIQFLSLATGGPSHYEGKDIKATHALMHITNPEFDATLGDLKASLDRLKIANREQRELLAVVESTRPQIVTER